MTWVEERDKFASQNSILKAEVINLEFLNERCNDKLFEKDGIIAQMNAVDNTSEEQLDSLEKENKRLARKIKFNKVMVYVATGAALVELMYILIKK